MKAVKTIVCAIIMLMTILSLTAYANESTTYCYTVSIDGDWIRTQDAFQSGGVLFIGEGLQSPEDIFIKDGRMYIADSGNGRIAVYDLKSKAISFFGYGVLKAPTGIFVSNELIYVADFGNSQVVVFGTNYSVRQIIKRPNSEQFGKIAAYKPKKVMTDESGNIYVISDGSYEGMLQFSKAGEFIGWFGVNQATVTPLEAIQDLLFTKEQKESLFRRIPRTIANACINSDNLIYSVTAESEGNAIKKHNMSGENILSRRGELVDERNFVDIAVSKDGFIYALTETGLINEYDNDGNIIISFGGRAISAERNGMFTVTSAIEVDDDGLIYVLDKERGIVQVFYPLPFATATHNAILSLKSGNYGKSKFLWEELLRLNGMSRLAHNGYGRTLFRERSFNEAAKHFKIAGNTAEYSEAFWEIRNKILNDSLLAVISVLLIIAVLWCIIKLLNKKFHILKPIADFLNRQKKKSRLFRDLLSATDVVRHPIDIYYYIKKGQVGTVTAAIVIYITVFVVFLFNSLFKGFIFGGLNAENVSVLKEIALFFIPVLLWWVCGYMVSSINGGEGSLKNVFIASAYSLSPYMLFMPFVIILSYFLTLNEAFIIEILTIGIICYTIFTLILSVKETHNYTFKETLKNIFITLFFMLIVIISFAVLYLLWGQIAELIKTIFGEMRYRAKA